MANERTSIHADRQFNPVKEGLEQTGLYHSIELPDGRVLRGAMPIEYQKGRLNSFRLPESLDGTRVLDVGPWDGWFTFELEKRGADVTAIDYNDFDTFRAFHALFSSKARYLLLDVYDLDPKVLGKFDIVLLLGVLYHLKHPLLALEKVCACTTDRCIIESFVTDGDDFLKGESAPIPTLEFYERGELSGQLDNWCGPTVNAISALARTAGFACTEVLRVVGANACIAAYRKWQALPPEQSPAPDITGLSSHRDKGRSFESAREEYIELWCQWNEMEVAPKLDEVFPEVDGFGVSPLGATRSGQSLMINFPSSSRACTGPTPRKNQDRKQPLVSGL